MPYDVANITICSACEEELPIVAELAADVQIRAAVNRAFQKRAVSAARTADYGEPAYDVFLPSRRLYLSVSRKGAQLFLYPFHQCK